MTAFLNKIAIFCIPLCSIMVVIVVLNIIFSNFSIDDAAPVLVLGNSHSECAINDSKIPGLVNLSASGEAYFYTYQKLLKIIEQNPHVSTVLLEFSSSQIRIKSDQWIWGCSFMGERFAKYAIFMDSESIKILAQNNPKCFKQTLPSILGNCIRMTFTLYRYNRYIGGHLALHGSNINYSENESLKNLVDGDGHATLSQTNLRYLHKIRAYCASRGVQLVLIRSPLHSTYQPDVSEEVFKQTIQLQFPDIVFLDFSLYPLSDDLFFDSGHLNTDGANIFSDDLNRMIHSGLFSVADKQGMINDHRLRRLSVD